MPVFWPLAFISTAKQQPCIRVCLTLILPRISKNTKKNDPRAPLLQRIQRFIVFSLHPTPIQCVANLLLYAMQHCHYLSRTTPEPTPQLVLHYAHTRDGLELYRHNIIRFLGLNTVESFIGPLPTAVRSVLLVLLLLPLLFLLDREIRFAICT